MNCLKDERSNDERVGMNIHTDTFKLGKVTSKITNDGVIKEEVIEHEDTPLLAPKIILFNDSQYYDFKSVTVNNLNDFDILIKNLLEMNTFLKRKENDYGEKI